MSLVCDIGQGMSILLGLPIALKIAILACSKQGASLENPKMILKRYHHKQLLLKMKVLKKGQIKEEEMRWPQSETTHHSLATSDYHDKGLQNYLPFSSFSAYLEGIKMVTSFPVFLCFYCKSNLLIYVAITGKILFYL